MPLRLRSAAAVALLTCVCAVPPREIPATPIRPAPDEPRAHPSSQAPLPAHFRTLIAARTTVDSYQSQHHGVDDTNRLSPVALRPNRQPRPVEVVNVRLPDTTSAYRASLPAINDTATGYRAPILDESGAWARWLNAARRLTPADESVAARVADGLAQEGLLMTVARTIEGLGARQFSTNGSDGLQHLYALGIPDDLLACFGPGETLDPGAEAVGVMSWIARRIAEVGSADALRTELAAIPFRFPPVWTGFRVATESGESNLGAVRMQVGGGFDDGIIPGETIHVIAQVAARLPDIDILLAVPGVVRQPVEAWLTRTLPLTRSGRVTLVEVPHRIESWAQDNGKAGTWVDATTGMAARTTVAPRYASRDEARPRFLPSESFVMDGLAATGQQVTRFPLHFQGGNLLAVAHPASGRRFLLLGEGVIESNRLLGLTRAQVLDSFRTGFGVDECVVVPAASYHLDFDVNVRQTATGLTMFVNDPEPLARQVVLLGIDALERHQAIDPATAINLRYHLEGRDLQPAVDQLLGMLDAQRDGAGRYAAPLAGMFRVNGADSGGGNLQVFLESLAVLQSQLPETCWPAADAGRQEFLRALRTLDEAHRMQLAALATTGWRMVKVPSHPNRFRSINYLNGVHYRGGYLLPAYGGFYASLDRAAEQVFRDELGAGVQIVPIQCAALQRKQGAVHCAVATYPALPAAAAVTTGF